MEEAQSDALSRWRLLEQMAQINYASAAPADGNGQES
jgi:hypothetical protein